MAKNNATLQALGLDLTGKVALVSGGGRGIGRAIAKCLAQAGCDVCVVARTVSEIERTRDEILAMGSRAIAVTADASDRAQVDHAVETCVKELGRPFILVLDHAMQKKIPTMEADQELWDQIMAVNLRGNFNYIQSAGKYMIENDYVGRVRGKILTISSITGLRGGKGSYLHYQTSKGGVIAMTKALAIEWAKHDITVNNIAPGSFRTEMSTWKNLPLEEQIKHIEQQTPMAWAKKSPVDPDETPELIGTLGLYLASPASDYTTGQVICIDGGTSEHF